jgi:biotin operon repressor
MSATCHTLLSVLSSHIGQSNGINVKGLAALLDCTERMVRKLVSELREDGTAVCGRPNTGYFIAANAEELEETCQFLRGRAMHSLHLESKLRNMPLPDLIGQMHLKT